jgi:membrane protein implicated in regulation of membrane protease activity
MSNNRSGTTGLSALLLLVPFVALLWVPFYNSIEPAIWGVPFFYWYQFLWVVLTSALIVWVNRRTR